MLASASVIRGGKVFIDISGDSTEFEKALTRTQRRIDEFTKSATKVGLLFSGFGAGLLTPLTLATKSFASTGDAIDKMSARTGVASEELSALGYVADRSGSSLESVDKAAKALYQAMDNAARGGKEASEAFDSLGLKASELVGLSLPQQLSRISDGMAKMASEEEKAAVGARLLGRSGYELLPLLKSGRGEIQQLTRRAKELGVVMSQESTTAAARLTDAMTDVKYAMRGLNNSVGVAMEPLVTSLANATAAVISFISEIVTANPLLVQTTAIVGGLAAAIGSLALSMAALGKTSSFALEGLKHLSKLLTMFKGLTLIGKSLGGLAVFLAPVVVTLAKMAAAAGAIYAVLKGVQYLNNRFGSNASLSAGDQEIHERHIEEKAVEVAQSARETAKSLSREAAIIELHIKEDAIRDEIRSVREGIENELSNLTVPNIAEVGAGPALLEARNNYLQQKDEIKRAGQERIKALENELQAILQVQDQAGSIQAPKQSFWNDSFTAEQKVDFDKKKKEVDEFYETLRKTRDLASQDIIYGNMIAAVPQYAQTKIDDEAQKAVSEELAIRQEIQGLQKQMVKADRDQAAAILSRVEVLKDEAQIAAKQVDRMEQWRKKAADAVEDVRRRANAMADVFDGIEADQLARDNEKTFQSLLDSGNWKTANEQVLAEMAKLESDWARNTAEIARMFERAQQGDLEALEAYEKLLRERQDLSTHQDALDARQTGVKETRKTVDDARLNVLKEFDSDRFLNEIQTIMRELGQEIDSAVSRAWDAERTGGDASVDYMTANTLLQQLQAIKDMTDSPETSVAGTYSGEAARRMDSGGGLQDIARQSLEYDKKIYREIQELNRKAGGGGMGF